MSLTSEQRALAGDAQASLKHDMSKLVSGSSNPLCPLIMAEYTVNVFVADTLILPAQFMKEGLLSIFDNPDIMDVLASVHDVIDVMSSGKSPMRYSMDHSAVNALALFNKICIDFKSIISNDMYQFIEDSVGLIDDIVNLPITLINLVNQVGSAILMDALMLGLDDITKAAMLPLLAYRDFIKSSGLLGMVEQLRRMERCLKNPDTCNRPKSELYYKGTRKYNSQYFADALAIDSRGELQLKKIDSSLHQFQSGVTKLYHKMDSYTTLAVLA